MVAATLLVLFAEITLGSWNLRWFPSGRAEHRASERVENANYEDAADVIRAGIASRGCVLFFQEMRDGRATTNLVAHIANTNLHTAVTTAFKMRDNRLGWQQCAIVTDCPVLDARWAYWRKTGEGSARPPRGYAYALVDAGEDGLVACFCVHLKSNYGAMTKEAKAANAAQREAAVRELLDLTSNVRAPDGRRVERVVIAGDFNTDPFSRRYAGERTVQMLQSGSYTNCFDGLPLALRGTHPGTKTYPDTTLDFFFHRGFARQEIPRLSPAVPLSDHRMIWTVVAAPRNHRPVGARVPRARPAK